MFKGCHDIDLREQRDRNGKVHRSLAGVRLRDYPDGEPWLEQEAIVMDVFNAIMSELYRVVNRG